MKNKKKLLLISLFLLFVVSCTNTNLEANRRKSNEVLKNLEVREDTPQEIIEYYYLALQTGNARLHNSLFYNSRARYIVKEIPDLKYRITGIRIISKQEVKVLKQVNPRNRLLDGDVEVRTEEVLRKNKEEITFILRRIKNKWRIYNQSIGS